ncbi:hypothetical protein CALVIDRAFT_279279 [Calocera viscosa TUFC12733]|uniref:DUF7587 domain-containing protein n=1 Tax=Calocera viscosa (strain TUFC12733) TaxID=1330018 RepID=A0A167R3T6_CALVF|nr:hypothetical protein CALVIDRAFT_279279 [Calocera viscosa TUFC12733]
MHWIYCDARMPNLWMARYDLPARLAAHKHLFLVDHALSPVPYDPARGFVAPRFASLWPDQIDAQDCAPALEEEIVRAHVQARVQQPGSSSGKRSRSPWVDASASWLLALWHATALAERGYPDVHLSVISVNSAPPGPQRERKWYALELLREGRPPALGVDDLAPEERWASVFQQVLVFGHVPASAVVSRVPVERLIPALPANFFHHAGPRELDNLVWFDSPHGVRILAPVGVSADLAHPGAHTEDEIGLAAARLAITTLHVPPCAILHYRVPIGLLAREVAQAFSSSAYSPDAWTRIELAVQRELDQRHREFVSAVREFVVLEMEYAQRALEDVGLLMKGTLEDNFVRPPRPPRRDFGDFVGEQTTPLHQHRHRRSGSEHSQSSSSGSSADSAEEAGEEAEAEAAAAAAAAEHTTQRNTLSRLAGIIEATREFEGCIRAARRVLDWLVPLREEDELVKEVLGAALGALAGREVGEEGER